MFLEMMVIQRTWVAPKQCYTGQTPLYPTICSITFWLPIILFEQNQLFGAGEDAQADAKKNLSKAQSAASSKGKEAEGNAKNAFETVQQNLSDAVENVQDSLKGKN